MEAVGGAGTTERKSCSLHSPLIGIVSQNANWVQNIPHTIKNKVEIRCFNSSIYNRLLLNILYVINQKYGLNL